MPLCAISTATSQEKGTEAPNRDLTEKGNDETPKKGNDETPNPKLSFLHFFYR